MTRMFPRAGSLLLAILLVGLAEPVLAYDASLPYQNYPSFECFRRNARGECVDFTYDPNDRSTSSRTSSSSRSSSSGSGDIEITIDPDGDAVRPGEFIEFVINLENTRRNRITTDVRAEFDSDFDFQSASDDGEEVSSDEVEWEDVRIDARDEEELEFRVRVRSGARVGRTLRVRVFADGEEAEATVVTSSRSRSNDDCDDDDDDDCEDLRSSGDVTVRISDSPDSFEPGQQVRYAIRIDNDEDYDRRIDVRAILDSDTTYVSASDSGKHTSRIVRWDDLRIDEDETITLLLVVYTDRDIRDGDEIHLEVEVNGKTEDEEDTEAEF